jgi:hypothetical protein
MVASRGITHIESGKVFVVVVFLFEKYHGGVPCIYALYGKDLGAAVGLWLVFGERPSIQVGRDGDKSFILVEKDGCVTVVVLRDAFPFLAVGVLVVEE